MADVPLIRVCRQLQPRTYKISSDSDPTREYTVYLGYAVGQAPTCDCLGYQVKLPDADGIKRCKHIRRLESGRCTYTEALDGPPRPSGRCPKCGDYTITLYVPHA